MTAAVQSREILSLYRKLLRQSNLFDAFNYRMYAIRKVRDSFKQKMVLGDPQKIQEEYKRGLDSLEMLKRQTAISTMYSAPKLVVEK